MGIEKVRRQSGFTLVEVLVVIGLIAVISAFAVPTFINWLPDYRLRSAAHDLLSNFQKAKLEAVKRNLRCGVVFASAGTGYTVFVDANENYLFDGEDTIVQVAWSDYKSVSIDAGNTTFANNGSGNPCIAFRSNGMPTNPGGGFGSGTARLTNTNGKKTEIIVSQAGNIRIVSVP